MSRSLGSLARIALLAAVSAAASSEAAIDFMYVNSSTEPKVCDPRTSLPIEYPGFRSADRRIRVARGATFKVTLLGFGADLATGTQDNITNLGSSIVGRGQMDKPGGGIHFGQRDQISYVRVEIRVHGDAELGPGSVRVNWVTGHELIPLRIVEACSTTPTPTPRPAGGGSSSSVPPPIRIGGGSSAPPSQKPDLVPTDFVNFRTGVRPDDCNGAFTGQRRFVQADLKFGVRNISSTAVTTPFVVLLRKQDGTELRRVTVPGLPGNGVAEFEFRRPNSEVCVQKGPNGLGCTGCPGVALIDDKGIEVVVDFDNNVTTEASETNNSRRIN